MLARAAAVEYYLAQRGLALGYASPQAAKDPDAKKMADAIAANWEDIAKSMRLEHPDARDAAHDFVSSLVRIVSGDPSGIKLANDLMTLAQYMPIPVYVGDDLYYMYKPSPEEVSKVEAIDYTFMKELLDPYISFDVERGIVKFGNKVIGKVDEFTGARIAAIMNDMSAAGAFLLQAALRQLEAFNRQLPEGATPHVHENLIAFNLDRILPAETRSYVESAYVKLQYINTPYTELNMTYNLRYLGVRDKVTVPLTEVYVVTVGADIAKSAEKGVRLVTRVAEVARNVDQEASRLGVRDIGVRIDETGALVYAERFIPVNSPVLRDARSSQAAARHVADKLREYLQSRGVSVEVHALPAEDGVTVLLQARSQDGRGAVARVHEARRLVDAAGKIIAEREVERFRLAAGLVYAEARARGAAVQAPRWVEDAAREARQRYQGLEAVTEKRGGETYVLGVPAKYLAPLLGAERLEARRTGAARRAEMESN